MCIHKLQLNDKLENELKCKKQKFEYLRKRRREIISFNVICEADLSINVINETSFSFSKMKSQV